MHFYAALLALPLVHAYSINPLHKREEEGLTCGQHGYDKKVKAYLSEEGGSIATADACAASCWEDDKCLSFAIGNSKCLLYKAKVSGNLKQIGDSPFSFYDKGCIARRTPDATATVCGEKGYDKQSPDAFQSSSKAKYRTQAGCAELCTKKSCASYAIGENTCLLYKAAVTGNLKRNSNSPYTFFDASCPLPSASSTGATSTVTPTIQLTVSPTAAATSVPLSTGVSDASVPLSTGVSDDIPLSTGTGDAAFPTVATDAPYANSTSAAGVTGADVPLSTGVSDDIPLTTGTGDILPTPVETDAPYANTTTTIVSTSTITGADVPLSTGASEDVPLTTGTGDLLPTPIATDAPYANTTSATVVTGADVPLSTGTSDEVPLTTGTGDAALPTIATDAPYANTTVPTATGAADAGVPLSTGTSDDVPLTTGTGDALPTPIATDAPYANTTVPTATDAGDAGVPLSTGTGVVAPTAAATDAPYSNSTIPAPTATPTAAQNCGVAAGYPRSTASQISTAFFVSLQGCKDLCSAQSTCVSYFYSPALGGCGLYSADMATLGVTPASDASGTFYDAACQV